MLVKLKINDSMFTNTFSVETTREFYLNLKMINRTDNLILKVSAVENMGKIIVFIEDSTMEPPFTIENNSDTLLKITESGVTSNNISGRTTTLSSGNGSYLTSHIFSRSLTNYANVFLYNYALNLLIAE